LIFALEPSKEREAHYRKKIDNAEARGNRKLADHYRYNRHCEGRRGKGQKPDSPQKWRKKLETIRNNQKRGAEEEARGREALKEHLGRDNIKDNNREGHKTAKDGTRPDSVGYDKDKKIDMVHDHKHLTGEGKQVVYDTQQMKSEREMLQNQGNGHGHKVTLSSDKPNLDGKPPDPRPSDPLGKKSDVYYVDKGEITKRWNKETNQWDPI